MATVLTSVFGFPWVLFNAGVITPGAFALSIVSATIMVGTQVGAIFVQVREDGDMFLA